MYKTAPADLLRQPNPNGLGAFGDIVNEEPQARREAREE